jgi:hypothetical protein
MFTGYNETLRRLPDKHAPLTTVSVRVELTAPWFDVECRRMKTMTRKLEKAYRSQPTDILRLRAWRHHFCAQRRLFRRKSAHHWSDVIETSRGDSRALWSRLRPLLQPASDQAPSPSAGSFANYFTLKVDLIRQSTANVPFHEITQRLVEQTLSQLRLITSDEITLILRKSPAKNYQLDPVPAWLLKPVAHVIVPVIANMCNASFQQQSLPISHKTALLRPLLKETTLDPAMYIHTDLFHI